MRHTVLLAVILGDLGPEEKQERETDGKVFHPCLHMQIATFQTTFLLPESMKTCVRVVVHVSISAVRSFGT